jgi:hypothetical protein
LRVILEGKAESMGKGEVGIIDHTDKEEVSWRQ